MNKFVYILLITVLSCSQPETLPEQEDFNVINVDSLADVTINKVNSQNGDKSIFFGSYQSRFGFTTLTGQQSNIMYGSDNQNGSLALTQNEIVPGWQHVAAVFTGDSMLVYINGELQKHCHIFYYLLKF